MRPPDPDDRFSLDFILKNGHVIRPSTGMVCPKCGFESHTGPDGKPTDSWYLMQLVNGVPTPTSAYFHAECATKALFQMQLEYVTQHVGEWITKEEYERRKNASRDAGA